MSTEELLDPKQQHELESPLDTPEPDPGNTTPDPNGQIKPMSKKAMKKAAKAERYQAFKLERRAREKQMQKEKKKLKAQKRAAGEIDDSAEVEEKASKKRKMSGFGGKVVLDMGFDTLMSEKVCSLGACNIIRGLISTILTIGNQFPLFTTRIYIQCKSQRLVPLLTVIHLSRW